MKYTGENSLTMLITLIKNALSGKVDKIEGKSLSTNDYTTAEKTKLAGLENYELPYASASTLGGVKVGNGLSITQEGVLSASGVDYDDTEITDRIDDIEGLIEEIIPDAATSSNQLADKAFVNSTVGTNTAIFRGTFDSVSLLNNYSEEKTNNDYAFVITTDTNGNTVYNRYKYNGTAWTFEYALNNSSFTAAQWNAINSGVTSSVVSAANSALQSSDLIEYTNSEIQAFWNSVTV